ncbi:alpha-L-fucosidase [Streptomyces sp. NPDC086549]|uniref:alpha-L-fucosidase n=1 Tax=Streptomyces sp. NPDC086549 TaxID=3365752 RepID=UPI0037FAB39C
MPVQPWFTDAKLGIFVHWGIYAVDGVQESWSFYDDIVPHDRYMSQLGRFTASRYDPGAWAKLFARAGARYAVLTSRHHDGVALWDTAHGELGLGRDFITPYADALRAEGLKVGLGTVRGLPAGHHHGPSTLSPDGRTLYLTLFDAPRAPFGVRGLRTGVRRVTVLGSGRELGHRVVGGLHEAPGVLWIDPPAAADLDPHATVLAVELEGELELYRGAGRF